MNKLAELAGVEDIGIHALRGAAGRGVPWPIESRRAGTDEIETWTKGILRASPHFGTHMDLPWAMEGVALSHASLLGVFADMARKHVPPRIQDDRPWREIVDWIQDVERDLTPRGKPHPGDYHLPPHPPDPSEISDFLQPALVACIVLDFTALADMVGNLTDVWAQTECPVLRPEVSPDEMVHLVENLCITKEKIEEGLQQCGLQPGEAANALILLRTSWSERFRPSTASDVYGPKFEGWNPWFVHPYLDGVTAEWLAVGLGVWGVAIDCVNMENPLYYAASSVWHSAKMAHDQVIGSQRFPSGLQLAHLNILWRGKRLIENVGKITSVPKGTHAQRMAYVFPFPLSALGDGAFIRLFLTTNQVMTAGCELCGQ